MYHNLLQTNQEQQLLRAGLEIFYQKGYYHTEIEDILAYLPMTKTEFDRLFESKEEFFLEIVDNLLVRNLYSVMMEPNSYSGHTISDIHRSFGNVLEKALQRKVDPGFALGAFIETFTGRNPRIMRHLNDVLGIWVTNLETMLQSGKQEGRIGLNVDSEAAARFIIGSYFGVRSFMGSAPAGMVKYRFMSQLNSYLNGLTDD